MARSNFYVAFCDDEQDPTQQTAIDNLMVQQLDGTVNEWGWCKQKVLSRLCLEICILNVVHIILMQTFCCFSLEQMPYWQCLLQSAELVLLS